MLKSEWKTTIALTSAILIPLSLLADTSITATSSSYLAGEKVKKGQLPAGYNESASYECQNPWKLDLTGDYIYWAWQQAMMEVGTLSQPTAPGTAGLFNGVQDVIFQTPGYQSGFQLGLGCVLRGMDDWSLTAEYTWYKNTDSLHSVATGLEVIVVSPSVVRHVEGSTPGTLLSRNLTTTAELNYNCVDLVLQRPFYFGKKLTANFVAAVEALWISQKFTGTGGDLSFLGSDALVAAVVSGSFNSVAYQKSWGLGPKFGFDSHWLLGGGVKIMSRVSLSALYTSYVKLSSTLTGAVSNINIASLEINQTDNYDTINPIGEAFLGLGWGTYFCNNNFHLDLSAGYDFKVYWSQNVLGSLVNSNGSPGDMSLRGLNIQVRFDF